MVWVCLLCGYVIGDAAYLYARHDYPCPGCEVRTFVTFKRVPMTEAVRESRG
jgi:rubrerythrin